ncbi:MAG: ADP-ribosylglycohydrolase family protein, partial [Thermomicrobiales bacterium]
MSLPTDYLARTYAGVLGKMIGVYLGRPFEFWLHERIEAELGEVWYYLHERFNLPLVVTDDDLSGTFTFLRALPDYGNDAGITAEQIGQTWLNYIIEGRTVLWWGGLGNSAEHTAYLRLKSGVPAPRSGSSELNGQVLAEQIGAQIFIDGWAMVAPADPARAADLARRAASVSHEGEAVYAAQLLAAMESQAYVECDIDRLLDCGLSFTPRDCTIVRLVSDLREWRARTNDWRETRRFIGDHYGYDTYRGNCHVVPNHALILLGLLYGQDDFQRSLMIANTSGWDTDCNSGNLGCLLGIKNGLAGIDRGPDWRGPVADRLYLSTADGGRAITDAASEAIRIVNIGRALVDQTPLTPKHNARYHFSLPGSVQGWRVDETALAGGALSLQNRCRDGNGERRVLALYYAHLAPGGAARAYVDTFIPPEAIEMPRYGLLASPTLYPGQVVTACLRASGSNADPVRCSLFLGAYDGQDQVAVTTGPTTILHPGQDWEIAWRIPGQDGQPVARVGIEIRSQRPTDGTIELDTLTWAGTPELRLARPATGGTM